MNEKSCSKNSLNQFQLEVLTMTDKEMIRSLDKKWHELFAEFKAHYKEHDCGELITKMSEIQRMIPRISIAVVENNVGSLEHEVRSLLND